jgi:hypothetical protein
MPSAFVVAGVWTPVLTLIAVTLASLTAAPLGSVTVPVIDPVIVCPNAMEQLTRNKKQIA